ncbi:MAG TPA: hypothetical protein VM099_10965, partial [Gemmatimonadaceae bacterium]|nr:hypothetical protein [Gemmatimonadaceae bacterium]
MNSRFLSVAACAALITAASATTACGQDTASTKPGVRLGLSYPRGSIPRVIVLPIDSTPGDSARTIIQRDLDFSDRVSPIPLDQATLLGITPPPGQEPNYDLFSKLGAAAIIQGRRTANGLRATVYDVAAKRRLESRELPMITVPPVRDASIRDSVVAATTLREKAIKDSVARVLRTRAAIMRRPPLKKDPRPRRFVVRDSLRRDSAATAYIRRGLARWDADRADSVAAEGEAVIARLTKADSSARRAAADNE